MPRFYTVITPAFLLATWLEPTVASAVPLSEYEQAADIPTKQMTIFKSDFETAVVNTLAGLGHAYFTDGKEKTPQRIQSDKERAGRIERISRHLTANQAMTLIKMIAEYAAAQPNTDLKDVIAGFLLTEAKNPLDAQLQQYAESREGYETTYRVFMENMDAWKRATDKAQAELDRQQADIDQRRKELNDSRSR